MIAAAEGLESRDFALGAVGSAISLSAGAATMKGLSYLGFAVGESHSFFRLYDNLSRITSGLLRGALKSVAAVYIILLGPIIEEWVFRGLVYKWQEGENPSRKMMLFRILTNGIFFSAVHVFQGWANAQIFLVAAIAGIVFASLREMTGNWHASAVAHSINNALVLFSPNYLRI